VVFEKLVFVVIDGLDASGKSTQGINLYRHLIRSGRTAFLRVHPSDDNLFGSEARRFLYSKGKSAHFASALFYMFDVIRSILLYSWRRYDYVVFVRYLLGTAYLPTPLDKIGYHFFASIVPTSNYMFFLDVRPEEANNRIRRVRSRTEMFESLENLKKIRRKAQSLVSTSKWRIIDGDKPQRDVERAIADTLGIPF
jgi:dTMP kinase